MKTASLVALALLAGCSTDPTALVVAVDTDIAVPAGVDRIVITISKSGEEQASREADMLSPSGLPLTLGVQHRGGPLSPIEVVAVGFSGGSEVVRVSATTGFIEEETRLLRLTLLAACQDAGCPSGSTCNSIALAAGGVCTSDFIAPESLPIFDGGFGPRPDASGVVPDSGVDSSDTGDDADTGVDADAGMDMGMDTAPNVDDTDGDGLRDVVECEDLDMPSSCRDTDGDGRPDFMDADDDGDGISTEAEVADAGEFGDDVDDDGLPNWRDPDSDGDGDSDGDEGTADRDGDGVPEYLDPRDCSTERCGNGADDDCDDIIDEPAECDPEGLVDVLTDPSGRAWDPADVRVRLRANGSGTLECRSAKVQPSGAIIGDFEDCPEGSFNPMLDVDTSGDGLYRTQVRSRGESGVISSTMDLDYYLHGSLSGADDCSLLDTIPPERFFERAAERLPTTDSEGEVLRFDPEAAIDEPGFVALANPFIRVNFTPRRSQAFSFQTSGAHPSWVANDGEVDVLSLRRRFILNDDQTMLLVGRRYAGRRNEFAPELTRCAAMSVRINRPGGGDSYSNRCDAIVFNRQGAGVCLQVRSGAVIAFARQPNETLFSSLVNRLIPEDEALVNGVDNALWRKLRARFSPNTTSAIVRGSCGSRRETCAENGVSARWGMQQFSPKCFGERSCVAEFRALHSFESVGPFEPLFLPDDEQFRF